GAKNKADVVHEKDGKWHFKAGSLIRVKLKVSAPAERFFVALVDPLPAGAEALNEDLNGAEHVSKQPPGDGDVIPLDEQNSGNP
ncbi:hypothetical protein ABTH99_18305, partial [Acinetobacter baumannii]